MIYLLNKARLLKQLKSDKLLSITHGCSLIRHKLPGLIATVLLLTAPTATWADKLRHDPLEKITIDADYMRLNIESGISVYSGNVKITQGELVLTGDKVTLEQKENEVERLTLIGKPARYNHITEKGQPIQAQSERMVYTASLNKLVMTKNASLRQPDHMVSSQIITYDTVKGIIVAGENNNASPHKPGTDKQGSTNESQRVNITLTPKKAIDYTNRSSSGSSTNTSKEAPSQSPSKPVNKK
jgi:lipopolysaccharide export system protein LptA